jgi:hypothetical protein
MKLMTLLLLLALPGVGNAQFTFTTNNGAITITGYAGSDGDFTVPQAINGLPVTDIGPWAFYSASITNVIIPDTITIIEDGAFFDCESLTNVTIGNSVTSIGDWTFGFCPSLNSVNFRGAAPNLAGDNVFYGNLATIYYLPEATNWTTTFDGHPAVLWNPPVPFFFATNDGMITITVSVASSGEVVIPNEINFLPVTGIGPVAFYGMHGLTNITISDSVTNIGARAFWFCSRLNAICVNTNNPSYSSVNGVLFNKNQTVLMQCPGGESGSYTTPNTVLNIADEAFYACTNLASVSIGTNVMSVGDDAFSSCSGLNSVTIGSSVTNIGDVAFGFCSSLSEISVDANNPFYSSVNGILFNKNQTDLVQFPSIKGGSFTIPDTVATIGDGAFAVSRLTSVTIPDSVNTIGDSAFEACTSLSNVSMGKGITSIGFAAFYECISLTDIIISCGVTNVADSAFDSCTNLNGFYFQGNAPELGVYAFNQDIGTVYYLPETTGWSATFGGLPTVMWNPQVQTGDTSFGVQENGFGFNILGNTNLLVVVEAATNLVGPVWIPVATNTLAASSFYFSDPQWTNYPNRYYRLSPP